MTESKYDKVHIAPIEIMKYFDIPKDAKFSLRTLLLLSVFTIAIFAFNIRAKLDFLSIPEPTDTSFIIFMDCVIIVQFIGSLYAYKLYKSLIDNSIAHLNNDIIAIEDALNRSRESDIINKIEKSSHTVFMEKKLFNHKNILNNSKVFYKFLTGIFTFIIAGLALSSIIFVGCTGKTISEFILSFP